MKSGSLSAELKETKGLSEHKSLGLSAFPNQFSRLWKDRNCHVPRTK